MEALDPLIGVDLGGYLVRRKIGEGDSGYVYLAEQADIGKTAAIKILKRELGSDAELIAQLKKEARLVSAIRHRGIIDIFAFGTAPDGREYVVMEYLTGESLRERLARTGKVQPAEAIAILEEVLAALAAAHRAGVLHRDIKPANIFLARQPADGSRYIKVLDFGTAKQTAQPFGTTSQTSERRSGTPGYMAPEQARGQSVGPFTDLYAVGAVAFEMISGVLPFRAKSDVDLVVLQTQQAAPRLSAMEPGLPKDLDQLVADLLEKEPLLRPSSADQVRVRLRDMTTAIRRARTPSAPPLTADQAPTEKELQGSLPSPAQIARAAEELKAPETIRVRESEMDLSAVQPAPAMRWWLLAVALGVFALALVLLRVAFGR